MDDRLLFLYDIKDNWDSYGARKPNHRAITNANRVIRLFSKSTPEPCIIPTPRGFVQFEWSLKGYDLEIECKENCFVVFFAQKDKILLDKTYDKIENLSAVIKQL